MSLLLKYKSKNNGKKHTIKKTVDQRIEERQQQVTKLQAVTEALENENNQFWAQQEILRGQARHRVKKQESLSFKSKLHENIMKAIQNLLEAYQLPDSLDANIHKLEKLALLKERNILTEEEFGSKKKDLLSRI